MELMKKYTSVSMADPAGITGAISGPGPAGKTGTVSMADSAGKTQSTSFGEVQVALPVWA